jgi:hypothetical protein
MVGFLRSAFLT